MPFVLPRTRWALTPPFHPYLDGFRQTPILGGFFSVALAVASWHSERSNAARSQVLPGSLSMEPGLSSAVCVDITRSAVTIQSATTLLLR